MGVGMGMTIRHRGLMGLLLPALLVLAGGATADSPGPYAGQESRSIKALSDADISGLRSGDGMGYAKAAELNGYPGPRHVLDLARELDISESQQAATQGIFDDMQREAVALGRELVAREAVLDALFADGTADAAAVARLTSEIGALEARLRAAHLNAHVRMRPVLTSHQVARYNAMRGYGGKPHDAHTGH